VTREQIIATTKAGATRAATGGTAVTPINPRHVKRLAELKGHPMVHSDETGV